MIRYIGFFLLFISTLTYAQKKEGVLKAKILDQDSHEVLSSAHVYNFSKASGGISNVDGEFMIRASVGDTIRISFVGYKTYWIRGLSKEMLEVKNLHFFLQRDFVELSEVVINQLGSYRSFKWNIINMDLPPSKEERLEESIDALCKLEVNKVKYYGASLILDRKMVGVSSGFDITGLATIFYNIEQARQEDYQEQVLLKKFNKKVLEKVSGFTGAKLDSFMVYCNVYGNFNYLSSEFELMSEIYKLLSVYNLQNDTI